MKSCENCGVPLEKRPGECIKLECLKIGTQGDCWTTADFIMFTNYAGWQLKEEQKTCGNCGNYQQEYENRLGKCILDNCCHGKREKAEEPGYGGYCSWKPKGCQSKEPKEECPTCGGTGKIKEKCKIHKYGPCCCVLDPTIPCPTCHPKEERLMVPVNDVIEAAKLLKDWCSDFECDVNPCPFVRMSLCPFITNPPSKWKFLDNI